MGRVRSLSNTYPVRVGRAYTSDPIFSTLNDPDQRKSSPSLLHAVARPPMYRGKRLAGKDMNKGWSKGLSGLGGKGRPITENGGPSFRKT